MQPIAQTSSWVRNRPLLTGSRILFWGLIQFALYMAEQVAELLAPLLFVAGVVWWAVLRAIGSIQLEDGALLKAVQHVPSELLVQGHLLTPGRLVREGLLLMAVVAACRTAHAIIAKET